MIIKFFWLWTITINHLSLLYPVEEGEGQNQILLCSSHLIQLMEGLLITWRVESGVLEERKHWPVLSGRCLGREWNCCCDELHWGRTLGLGRSVWSCSIGTSIFITPHSAGEGKAAESWHSAFSASFWIFSHMIKGRHLTFLCCGSVRILQHRKLH